MDINKSITTNTVANKMRFDYIHCENEPDARLLDALHRIISDLQRQPLRLNDFLNDSAQFVYRQLNIHNLSIGILDSDNIYRYHAFAGLRKSAEMALKKCAFTKEQFSDQSTYPGTIISKYTKLFLAESNPYAPGEEETFNRPLMLTQGRKEIDDTIEGDYLDIHALNNRNEIIAFIEISGTKNGKLPDVKIIKWLEVIASLIGIAIDINKKQYEHRRPIIMGNESE